MKVRINFNIPNWVVWISLPLIIYFGGKGLFYAFCMMIANGMR